MKPKPEPKPYSKWWLKLSLSLPLIIWALIPGNYVKAQTTTPPPDCIFFISASLNAGSGTTVNYPNSAGFDNRSLACQTWTFSYAATATSGTLTSLDFQAAAGAVSAGSFSTWGGTVNTGINPNTSSTIATSTFSTGCSNGMACNVSNAWVKILVTRNSFVGTIRGVLYGYRTGYAGRGSGGGSSGTVTNVATGCGLSGGPITTSGTIALSQVSNHQTGTTYAILNSDCGKLLTLSNAGAVAVSVAQAGSAGSFISGWSLHMENLGAGTVTITPSTSTIDGAATLTLATNQGVVLFSDGTNYFTERGRGSTTSGTVTSVGTGCGLSGGTITASGTVIASMVTNTQTGTTYAILDADCGKLLTLSNAGAVAASIAQAGTAGSFASGWFTHIENLGAGTVTITATASTIDGSSTLVIPANQGVVLFSNGANYFTERGLAPSGSAQLHTITFNISGGGSVVTTGDVHNYLTVDYSCTINRIDTSGNPSGSATVDIWKAAGAIPTSGNKISASAPATLSSSQLSQNGSISGWTTGVSSGDVFDASVATATTVTSVTVQIWCQ